MTTHHGTERRRMVATAAIAAVAATAALATACKKDSVQGTGAQRPPPGAAEPPVAAGEGPREQQGAPGAAAATAERSSETGETTAAETHAAAGGMTLTSSDFADGEPIPRVHAYAPEGENRPPELSWSGLPEGTVELALIVEDPDAPRPEPWVHDVLYKIPPDASGTGTVLRGATADSAGRFLQGVNSWGRTEWGGPLPPPGGPHRYFFTLYALDAELDLLPGATKEQLLGAMEGHILGTATLMGTYRR